MLDRTIAQYRVEAELGRGGMGVVYRARDMRLGREVALKLLPAESSDAAARDRQLHEARMASALNHPHIATLYEVGEAEGQFFIAMELVEGKSLAALISAGGLPAETVARYGAQIADALDHAHARNIIHRDLKSANVIVTPEGRAKVLDFGLAQRLEHSQLDEATRSQASLGEVKGVAGTLPYMAPEQLRGEPADARTDIWALGVVLYEMAAGKLPFSGTTGFSLSSAILRESPLPLPERVPPGLRAVIQRCLAKEAAQRYQRASEARAALETLSHGSGASAVAAVATPPERKIPWKWLLAPMALVIVLTVLFALNVGGIRQRFFAPAGAPKIESIAVLPLENLSGDASQEYFADGMTEALISNLAQIRALKKVISRTTVMRYKGSRQSLPEIARELAVDAVIEGSVQRSPTQVKISAQLIYASSEAPLWSKEYLREVSDVLNLQSEIARDVAQEIRLQLTPQEQSRLASPRNVSPEAYDYFLRGRSHSRRENRDDNNAAIELLEKAVAADPQFPAAHAELARAYGIRVAYFAPYDKQLDEKSLQEVDTALRLDPESSDAHLARGVLLWRPRMQFPHEQAIREFRRAIDLNPSSDEAHHQLGLVYLHVGLLDEALREAQEAVRLNPGNTLALYRQGVAYLYRGEYQQAWLIFEKVPVEFNPVLVSYQNAWTLFYLGRKKEADAATQKYLEQHPEDTGGLITSMQAILAADAGDAKRAEEKIRAALEHGKGYIHFHHSAYDIAAAYALLNKPDPAMRWLQTAADGGFPCYPLFAKDPNLDKIRRYPAFQSFLARQKEIWEAFKKL